MAKPSRLPRLLDTVTVDVAAHPRDLTRYYADRLKISRVSANKYIRQLEQQGWIARSGPSTHPVFSVGYNRRITSTFPIFGMEEDLVWEKFVRQYLDLSKNVMQIVNHGFTEMLNNAIDHSSGESVFIWVSQSQNSLISIISDDGIGIFEKISKALQLPDKRQALFELAKGKLTTDPSKHTGEGVFFTSRMFDYFEIHADGLTFNHDDFDTKDIFQEATSPFSGHGTTVLMQISLDSSRTTESVFAQFTDAPEDYDFSKTIVPMKLAAFGEEQLVSRSQAKRLIARFDRFRTVILDFSNVNEIGQAFADEIFRVYGVSHPSVELSPQNMTNQVERMWRRALAPRTD